MTLRALLIDDDSRLSDLLRDYLGDHDIELLHASTGLVGLQKLREKSVDVVLLDVMMRGMDGLEALRRIRSQYQTPVIMLTARGDEADRIVGLELGADDYLPKPFSPRELLARMRAVLRRSDLDTDKGQRIQVGAVLLDLGSRSVFVGKSAVELTAFEFDLLHYLMLRKGRVVQRQSLLNHAGRDEHHVGVRAVDVHISKLRKKLGNDAGGQIHTIRNVGYLFSEQAPEGGAAP